MPDDLPAGEAGEVFEAYWIEGFAIDLVDEPVEATHKARARFLEAGRGVDAANQLIGLAGVYRREAYPLDERRRILAQARVELEALPASPERDDAIVGLLIEEAQVAIDAMDLSYARSASVEGAAISRRLGDEGSAIFADATLGMVDVIEGKVDAGLELMTSSAVASQAAGYEDAGITAFRNTSTSAIRALEYRIAAASIGDGMRYADKIQQAHCRHVMAGGGALLEWTAGRWDAAVAFAGQELADPGCQRGALACEVALGYVAFGRGEYDEARALLGSALARGGRSGAIDLILPAMWGLAETELHSGNAGAATERCTDAFERAVAVGEKALLAPFAVTGVRAFLATGRPDAADRWAEQVVAQIEGWSPNMRPAVDHVKGLSKLASGSTGVAREMLEAAAHGWDDRGRIWEATWARLDLAGCLLRSNRVGEAAGVLAVAGEVTQRLGSPVLLARTEELARAARSRGALDEPWRPLTGREFEVARLIADGLTNAEIAGELSISPKTASAHVEHILAKLAVARRAEIAAWVTTVSRTDEPTGIRVAAGSTTPCLPSQIGVHRTGRGCKQGRFRRWGTMVRRSRATARRSSPEIWPRWQGSWTILLPTTSSRNGRSPASESARRTRGRSTSNTPTRRATPPRWTFAGSVSQATLSLSRARSITATACRSATSGSPSSRAARFATSPNTSPIRSRRRPGGRRSSSRWRPQAM